MKATVNNVLVKYTISEVNNLNHDKLIKEIREADIQTYSEISGIPKTIFEERQNEIKEQQQKSFEKLIVKIALCGPLSGIDNKAGKGKIFLFSKN